MKTINFKLSMMLVMVSTLFISCNSNEPVDTAILANQQVSKELKSSYNLLDITPNVYHDYFKKTDFSAGFSSLKDNSLAQPSVVQLNDIDSKVKTLSYTVNGGSKTQLSKSSKLSGADSQSIYGKTISFKINNSSTSNKVNTDATEVNMYVPELVEITNPKITNSDELLPSCYSKDFVLEWNADPNNKEGLVVIAEYFGNNAVPINSTDEHILNTDMIKEDNGRAVLNNDLFKDIPNLSIVHIVLLRGNVDIQEIDGELYKFFAESHVRLPIILVKDLNTVAKE